MYKNKGFTVIEILIVILIMGFISSIVLFSLSGFKNEQALRNTTSDIVSLLNEARQKTLSSVNSTNYSIHFENNSATLFTGETYSAIDTTNQLIEFNSLVEIPSFGGLNIGGGNDVSFERLTGDTIGGTIIVRLIDNPIKQKIITIDKTGVVSLN